MTTWEGIVEAAEAIRAGALAGERSLVEGPLAGDEWPLAGVGWATVEAERAQRQFDALIDPEAVPPEVGAWEEQPRDTALGARVWLRGAPRHDREGLWLVVLEPDTEGRLAATLARRDEGLAVIYLGTGPYRAGRLRSVGQPWGPHVVALEPAGAGELA